MSGDTEQSLILSIVVAAWCCLLTILGYLWSMSKRRRAGDAKSAASRKPLADQNDSATPDQAVVDLENANRKLTSMLADANQKIADLRKLSPAQMGEYHPSRPAPPQRAEVQRLADQGLDNVEIARRMGMEIGMVELMLNLRAQSDMQAARSENAETLEKREQE